MKAKDLEKLVMEAGWYFVRQSGSHRIFKHDSKGGRVVIPMNNKDDMPIGTLHSILKKAGLK